MKIALLSKEIDCRQDNIVFTCRKVTKAIIPYTI